MSRRRFYRGRNMLEIVSACAILPGRDDAGREAIFFSGGTEFFRDGYRLPETGFTFFYAYTGAEPRLRNFSSMPMFFMIPWHEPYRLEFYLPPEANLLRFPLIFEKTHESTDDIPGEGGQRMSIREGILEGQYRIPLAGSEYTVKEGRILGTSFTAQEGSLHTGYTAHWRTDQGRPGPPGWSAFTLQRNPSRVLAALQGSHQMYALGGGGGPLRIREGRNRGTIELPVADEYSLTPEALVETVFGPHRMFHVFTRGHRSGTFLMAQVPMGLETKCEAGPGAQLRFRADRARYALNFSGRSA